MKVRKQKLLSMLLCTALTITSIVSDGFQVSAAELQPQPEWQVTVEEGTVSENEMPETQSPNEETEGNTLPEETDSTTDNVESGKTVETETGTEAEETAAEETKTEETETETTEDEEQTLQEESDITELETSEETQKEPSESEEELTEEAGLDAAAEDIASGSYKDITWKIDADGKLTVTGTGEFSDSSGDDRAPWYDNRESIISAEIEVSGITDASYMFYNCINLISVDLSKFDTGQVTDMSYMFDFCLGLKSVNVSGFDTGNVTNMSAMFAGCRSLKSVDVSNFDTSQVTDMGGMFIECSSLQSIDVSSFDTCNVTDMSGMFTKCSSLQSVDVSGFDTGNVTNMNSMFDGCSSLQSVDVSSFNTGNVTDMCVMFSGCSSLQSIDVSSFDTGNVTDMSGMFSACSSLKSVNASSFDTSNVTNMVRMFGTCENLQSIDLTSFDTGNVADMSEMFLGCNSLQSVNLSGFDMKNVTDISGIFDGCINLATIYTPYNLQHSITLPKAEDADIWYQPDGTEIAELPKNLDHSIIITKNSVPAVDEPHITATKTKTNYGREETLNTNDLTVTYYDKDGTVKEVTDYTTNADEIDMSTSGTKLLTITYNDLATEIEITVKQGYIVTFDMNGHGTQIDPLTGITSGSKIAAPKAPTEKDWEFGGWYKDAACKEKWDFGTDTVKKDTTLYASWRSLLYTQSGNLMIQKIPNASYTGSALKPKVTVYYLTDDGQQKRLTNGKDYTIKYFNNIQADTDAERTLGGTGVTEKDSSNGFTKNLAYVVITCKGNYTGTVYQNFHIDRASVGSGSSVAKGFTLEYMGQLAKSDEPLAPFTSLKYKKDMTAGKDYKLTLTTMEAYNARRIKLDADTVLDGKSVIPSIPAGYYGTFLLTVTGIGNYTGTFAKTLYVAGKNYLMKNASVSLGKNQKSVKYTGDLITLTPGWYDVSEKKYYYIKEKGKEPEDGDKAEKKNIFTVRIGKEYLLYGKDFEVSYSNNKAVGTATMTITGIGDYAGVKKITFHITGTTFNAKNIDVDNFKSSMVFTGSARTQDAEKVALTDMSWKKEVPLNYGEDYTISYKNNVNAGTATVIFTGNPESGYSGSFKKTFQITPVGLRNRLSGSTANPLDTITEAGNSGDMKFGGNVTYTRTGAKISDRITLTDKYRQYVLKEGTDYTVSYSGNKKVTTPDSPAVMTVTGMGNYKGSIKISFPIQKASLSDNANLKATASEIAYNSKKGKNSKYRPKIKITDQKKALSASKDFEVEYINCSQEEVTSYLEASADGAASADARPYAIVTAREGSNYTGSMEVDLTIYQKKLSTNRLYVVVSKEEAQVTYTGRQVRPDVTVYYGSAKAVQKAKAAKETDGSELTDPDGKYRLNELTAKEGGVGDYTLTYGANITAGKNKGSVTVTGAGMYGGKVTVKFTVLKKAVNDAGGKSVQKSTVSIVRAPERPGTAGVMNADILFSDFRKRYCS